MLTLTHPLVNRPAKSREEAGQGVTGPVTWNAGVRGVLGKAHHLAGTSRALTYSGPTAARSRVMDEETEAPREGQSGDSEPGSLPSEPVCWTLCLISTGTQRAPGSGPAPGGWACRGWGQGEERGASPASQAHPGAARAVASSAPWRHALRGQTGPRLTEAMTKPGGGVCGERLTLSPPQAKAPPPAKVTGKTALYPGCDPSLRSLL